MDKTAARLVPQGGPAGDAGDAAIPPVYLFPGLGGQAQELTQLAALLAPNVAVVTVEPPEMGADTVEAMAKAAWAAIRSHQPSGPYRMFGYSFGGLVAIETGRLMLASGARVEPLMMADAVFDRRFWPRLTFWSAQLRRTLHHLAAIRRLPLAEALATIAWRARRLRQRLAEQSLPPAENAPLKSAAPGPALGPAAPQPTSGDRMQGAKQAMARYQPRLYPGEITLIVASPGTDFGCDVARLWQPHAARLSVTPIRANHLGLVRDAASLMALSHAVAARLAETTLAQPGRKTVLIVTRQRWLATARVALGLAEAGLRVEALCPRGHPMVGLPFVAQCHHFGLTQHRRSLARAIALSAPDRIILGDESTLSLVQAVLDDPATPAETRAVLQRSLGGAAFATSPFAAHLSRDAVLSIATAAGIACPDHAELTSLADLDAWLARTGSGTAAGGQTGTAETGTAEIGAVGISTGVVIKSDGSWGGRGVTLAPDLAAAHEAFRRLGSPPPLLRVLKRLIVNRDLPLFEHWLARRSPTLSVQQRIVGHDATLTAAAEAGEVLASIEVDVLETSSPQGPATVVQRRDDPAMRDAAQKLAAQLGLSGLFGLDFVVDAAGKAWLIEMNPRVTQTSHLARPGALSPLAALALRLTGVASASPASAMPASAMPDSPVVLFPQGLQRRSVPPVEAIDIPWNAPELVRRVLSQARSTPRPLQEDILARLGPNPPAKPQPDRQPDRLAKPPPNPMVTGPQSGPLDFQG